MIIIFTILVCQFGHSSWFKCVYSPKWMCMKYESAMSWVSINSLCFLEYKLKTKLVFKDVFDTALLLFPHQYFSQGSTQDAAITGNSDNSVMQQDRLMWVWVYLRGSIEYTYVGLWSIPLPVKNQYKWETTTYLPEWLTYKWPQHRMLGRVHGNWTPCFAGGNAQWFSRSAKLLGSVLQTRT